jgi:transcriptional/translational regulatory protein YebC/TACO1
MSGHSKWSTIKHKKGAADAKRGKVFSKLAKELTISARISGGDPGSNITLRTILSKCKAANMPADNIDRAIKKGTGALQSAAIEEIIFESYAPGGVGMIIQCLSDNRNRSVAEVRHLLQRHNGTLAGHEPGDAELRAAGPDPRGSRGRGRGQADGTGARGRRRRHDERRGAVRDPDFAFGVQRGVGEGDGGGLHGVGGFRRQFRADGWAPVTDKSQAASLMKLIEAIEELEDVQNVYMNGDIADEAIEE